MVEREPGAAPAPAARVHPHPIRWDADAQLWVCTRGCGFSRPKREAEVVPSREEALQEARRAGTGADFADLGGRTTRTAPDGAAAPPPDGAAGGAGSPGDAGRPG
ncbi:MAG TPA: hypothetical protein VNK05_01510 [Chloroflexota bacterium]|nr:hypothetical protein [Chloroflexota bacterium]